MATSLVTVPRPPVRPIAVPRTRISLVVGIAGHHDMHPHSEAPLRARFGTILDEFAGKFPQTPLLVMSALAPGADTIAVEVAIARGVPVIAALPLPPDAYEATLADDERERFRDVLQQCARVDVVATTGSRATRDAHLGIHIAYYSHVVVAFWDSAQSAGHAANVVNLRVNGVVPQSADAASIPAIPDVGAVFHVITPRASESHRDPLEERRIYPVRFHHDRNAERDFWASLQRLDLYNRDLNRAEARSKPLPTVEDLRERTGEIANDLQRSTLGWLLSLYFFSLVAAVAQVVAGGERGEIIKLGTMALAFVFYGLARHMDVEDRYQDYRALSEGLRVQTVWMHIGLRADDVERSYLRMQQSELQWIRLALRYVHLAFIEPQAATPSVDDPVCQTWIRMQWRYYYRAARREAAGSKRLVLARKIVFITALAATLIGSVVLFAGWGAGTLLQALTTAPLAIAAAVAILIANYSAKRGYESNVRRYERMFIVFDRARRELGLIRTKRIPGDPLKVVRELGQSALIEHADWLLARRERPWTAA